MADGRNASVITGAVVLTTVLVCFRALVVANYQPQTTLAVFNKAGAASVLVGSVLPPVPLLLPLAVILICVPLLVAALIAAFSGRVFVEEIYENGEKQKFSWVAVTIVLGVVTAWTFTAMMLALTPTSTPFARSWVPSKAIGEAATDGELNGPPWLVGMLLLLFAILAVASLWPEQRLTTDATPAMSLRIYARLLLGFVSWTLVRAWPPLLVAAALVLPYLWSSAYAPLDLSTSKVLSAMWLPPENFVLVDGRVLLAYSLEDTPRESVLLTHTDRVIDYVRPADIADRYVCRLEPDAGLPAWRSTEAQRSTLPDCQPSSP